MALHTFHAFKSRNFRFYFIGQSVSLTGTWMQRTAVGWLIYERTHSSFMLGLTLLASLFPTFIFSFPGGIAADRYNRFRLMLLTQTASLVQAILLTVAVLNGCDDVCVIITLSVLLGVINAFDIPARQMIIEDIVGNDSDLPNVLALNSSMVNLTRLAGPGLAGLILHKFGAIACFGLNAVSYIGVIGALFAMRLPKQLDEKKQRQMLVELREGFQYVLSAPHIRATLLLVASMSLLVTPFVTLMPVYAKDVFKGNAATFGILESGIGAGAFAGAIYLAFLKKNRSPYKVILAGMIIFGCCLLGFAWAKQYPLAVALATIGSIGMMIQVTTSNTLLQTQAAKPMRGRVVSYFAMAFFGVQPIGGLLIGILAQCLGAQTTIFMEGLAALAIAILYTKMVRRGRSDNP